MASRKDEKEEPEKRSAENSGSSSPQQRPEMQYEAAAARSIDETQQNIREAMEEARKEIPRYNQIVNDYRNQTIDATKDIAESYLDSQRQAINSMQSSWMQAMQQQQQQSWWGWGMPMSPQAMADLYTKVAGSFADATIAATRMANNMMFANIEAARTAMNNARDNAREMARIATDFSRTFRQASSLSSLSREARSRA